MGDWDFLYDLSGQELLDAIESGGSYSDWDYLDQEMQESERSNKQINKQINKQSNSRRKKKNLLVVVDGENISSRFGDQISFTVKEIGNAENIYVYSRQKDNYTKSWKDVATKNFFCEKKLYGAPQKDKVDEKIIKDIYNEVASNKSIDIVCIVSNDGGFSDVVENLRNMGKRVEVIGTSNISNKLLQVSNQVWELQE